MSDIRIDGLEEVLERLDSVANVENIKQAMGKACALVEGAAKRKAPKDTGELRRSITSKVESDGNDILGIIYTPLEYAPYVEYGTGIFAEEEGRKDVPWHYQDDEGNWHSTSGQKPHPYMRPALNENMEQIKRILREAISND